MSEYYEGVKEKEEKVFFAESSLRSNDYREDSHTGHAKE